jgi:hypothetical protein
MDATEYRNLIERFKPLAKAGMVAVELHRSAIQDGVTPMSAAFLLRDLYGMNLMECKLIHANYSVGSSLASDVANRLPPSPDQKSHTPKSPELKPCPYCAAPLRTNLAEQCFKCGADWHSNQSSG